MGTCPKCEAEVRYLERELEKRQRLGKAVAIAGLSVGMLGALDSCGINKKTDSRPVDEWHLMGLPAVEVQVEDELLPKEIKEVSSSERQDTTCFELKINSSNVDEMLDNAVSKYIEETILGYSVDQLPQFPGGDPVSGNRGDYTAGFLYRLPRVANVHQILDNGAVSVYNHLAGGVIWTL